MVCEGWDSWRRISEVQKTALKIILTIRMMQPGINLNHPSFVGTGCGTLETTCPAKGVDRISHRILCVFSYCVLCSMWFLLQGSYIRIVNKIIYKLPEVNNDLRKPGLDNIYKE
jgi:hypothetical protein